MDNETKRLKAMHTNEIGSIKTEVEASSGIGNKIIDQNPGTSEPPKHDYIHVRARRGQATDSHSLAERVSMLHAIGILLYYVIISSLKFTSTHLEVNFFKC